MKKKKQNEETKLETAKERMRNAIGQAQEFLERPEHGAFLEWLESEARSLLDCWHDENQNEKDGGE